MAKTHKPGTNTGNAGGIFQQVTQGGKLVDNFATVPDNRPLPPTTKPGHQWSQVSKTPNSKR